MAIQRGARAARIDAGLRVERSIGAWRPATRAGADPGDRVEAPERPERLRAQREILRCALEGVEEASETAARMLFEAAGRSAHLDAVAQQSDVAPPAIVQHILSGITGYIYGGFRRAHPHATVDDFDRFTADVLRGLERGLDDARCETDGLGALTPELAKRIDRIEELVREGLEVFFSDERGRSECARVGKG